MHRANSAEPVSSSDAAGASGIQSSGVPSLFKQNIRNWSDDTAVAAACDVLKHSGGYPTEADRRALYKEWLAIYASERWHDSFDELMLQCITFTPSPTSPTEPLFGDVFKLAAAHSWDPVLDTVRVTQVFNTRREDKDELPAPSEPSSLSALLAGLLSTEGSESLNEAGMLIGFCSLLLCSTCLHDVAAAEDVFTSWSMSAPSSIFSTSYVGRIMCPKPAFLEGLNRKTSSHRRVLIPYAVVLPVAQFVLFKKTGREAPLRDLAFLNSAFLTHTRYGGLETPNLLRQFADATGLSVGRLNTLMGGKDCKETRDRVENYLRSARSGDVVVHSMPWCRMICRELFWELEVKHNIDYALRIMCYLLPERHISLQKLRAMPDFGEITQVQFSRACLWAKNFEDLLARGLLRPQ